jgi:hypothetical protein
VQAQPKQGGPRADCHCPCPCELCCARRGRGEHGTEPQRYGVLAILRIHQVTRRTASSIGSHAHRDMHVGRPGLACARSRPCPFTSAAGQDGWSTGWYGYGREEPQSHPCPAARMHMTTPCRARKGSPISIPALPTVASASIVLAFLLADLPRSRTRTGRQCNGVGLPMPMPMPSRKLLAPPCRYLEAVGAAAEGAMCIGTV